MSIKNLPSPLILNQLINNFKKKDSKTTSIEEYLKDFTSLVTYFGFATFEIPATIKIHRARINDNEKDFTYLKELWCPPIDKIKKVGRCNEMGEQILYMSGGGDTALREINPPIGSIVTCLECEVIENIRSIEIGVLKNNQREIYLQQTAAIHKTMLNEFYGGNKKLIDLDIKLKNYLVDEFTKYVGVGEEHLYNKTISIAKYFLSVPTIETLTFPSIKSNLQNINYAIPKNFAETKLKPLRVDVFRIVPSIDKQIRFELIKGCYKDLNFHNPIVYTKPQPIQSWAFQQ